MIRDALDGAGVIHVRKFCVPGELCYGYRLCPPHDQGFSHYQPTTKRLINKIMAWRAKEFREVRLPLHRELRRFVKAITIDETAALRSVQGSPWERSAQVAMIQRIVNGDFFTVVDRFGRFHTNLTNLKATLRPFLRYRDSHLVNLDLANSQPMIFCLLLVNLLSNEEQLDNLIDYSFPETSYSYLMDIDQDYLDSLSSLHHHNDNNQEEGEGGSSNSPILHANRSESSYKVSHDNMLGKVNNRQTYPNNQDNKKEEGEGGSSNSPILHANDATSEYNIQQHNNLQRLNNRQTYPNNQEGGEGGGRNTPILHANVLEHEHKTKQDNRLGRLINRQTLPDDVVWSSSISVREGFSMTI